jgi:hypothetical protein
MESHVAATCSQLEVDFSLLSEDYFGERVEDSSSAEGSGSESDSSGEEENDIVEPVELELRGVDKDEEEALQNFIKTTCGCSMNKGVPCSGSFGVAELRERRMMMAELESSQLDCVILGQIGAHRFSGKLAGHHVKGKQRRRHGYTTFFYQGRKVCLKTFLFLHVMGKKRFRNLVKHFQENGMAPRIHGNTNRLPWNASSFHDKKRAITFIKNYSEIHALPLPGRMPKFNDYSIMLLPTDASKASVHREYVKASQVLEDSLKQPVRCYGYREFCRLWSEVVPYIRVMPPATDLCPICQDNVALLMKSANVSEDEKAKLHIKAQDHLKSAKLQRAYYKEGVMSSKVSMEKVRIGEQTIVQVLSLSYSFDHAQQIHYPSNPLQPGPLFLKLQENVGCLVYVLKGKAPNLII